MPETFEMNGRERCKQCWHDWSEHDGMGDCHHPDGRTATGLCKCGSSSAGGSDGE